MAVLRPHHSTGTLPPCVVHGFCGAEVGRPANLPQSCQGFPGVNSVHGELMENSGGFQEELAAYRELDFFIGVTGFICQKKCPLKQWLLKCVSVATRSLSHLPQVQTMNYHSTGGPLSGASAHRWYCGPILWKI